MAPKTRVPAKITPSYLENAALHYLERFASSSANLRRVMMRKISLSVAHWGGEREDHISQLDAVMAKLTGLGYLNDAAYAEQKVRSLHRQGKAGRTIRATLAAKGVQGEMAQTALDRLSEDMAEPDLHAAVKLARKRRIGPFRPPETRAEFRQKDLGTLARAGFAFELARRVIEAESVDRLDEELAE